MWFQSDAIRLEEAECFAFAGAIHHELKKSLQV